MKKTKIDSYILEDVSNVEFKESIAQEDIDKINKFTVNPVESKDIKVYTALLIDDKMTRNNTVYNKEFQSMLLSLPVGEGNFIGAPILFGDTKDHQHAANAQVGRIFEAEQVVDKEGHYGVMAKLYVLVSNENEDLIKKIDSGILKEMSISTKVELPICSLCGQDIRSCDHTIGQNGCYVVMSGTGFVAETSFVAVPGSNVAKILNDDDIKNFLRLENFEEMVMPLINESIQAQASGVVGQTESFKEQLSVIAANYDELKEIISNLSAKYDAKEAEVISYKIDILSTLTDLKEDIDKSKGFVITNLSKYSLTTLEFRSDMVPDLTQGLKGEDISMIFKLFYDNLEIMGINLSTLEEHLKVTPANTNLSYTGDLLNIPLLARFLVKKNDDIKVRIFKLKGKFDLELQERNNLIQEAIKYGMLTDKFAFKNKELSEKFFEKFSTEEIITLKDEFFAEGSKIFINKEIKKPEVKEEKTKNVKTLTAREIANKILNKEK